MTRFLFLLPAVALVSASQASAAHPLLHHAVYDIRHAIAEIEGANHTHFSRHQEAALRDLRHALIEVDRALADIGDPVPHHFRVVPNVYRDYKDHRHLRHADQAIHEAIGELRTSKAFGDRHHHKDRAIRALAAAHEQVQVLIRLAR